MTALPAEPPDPSDSSASETRHDDGIGSVSFIALLFTQLLTAINDNVFRWLAIGVGKDYVDQSQIGMILMAGTACFVIPYLILAAPAGYLADRFSKRNVIVGCKITEIVIMTLGVAAIAIDVPPTINMVFLFTTVGLMGAQSALFSPSKMGCIPELMRAALETARQALQNGEIVGVFPEGGMTRSGVMQAFRPGVLRVLEGTDVPVIPVYLDELWGSIFSFRGGRFLWK